MAIDRIVFKRCQCDEHCKADCLTVAQSVPHQADLAGVKQHYVRVTILFSCINQHFDVEGLHNVDLIWVV